MFDPALAGAGVHELTYRTPSCSNLGRLRIRVVPPPVIELLSPASIFVCESENIQVLLQVHEITDAQYTWYFRANTESPFIMLSVNSNQLVAKERGEYQVVVSRLRCSSTSPVFSIVNEVVLIDTPVAPRTCTNRPEIIGLLATPAGGVWSGVGISGSTFNSNGLVEGSYALTYRLTTERGCRFEKQVIAKVIKAFVPTISKIGNLCEGGEVKLKVNGEPPPSPGYSWALREGSGAFFSIGANEPELIIQSNGEYQLRLIHDQVCQTETRLIVKDEFDGSLKPDSESISICSGGEFFFETASFTNASYEWYYSADVNSTPSRISNTERILKVTESGYYSATISRGFCTWRSSQRKIEVLPPDSLMVPNVFTPNQDGKNDVFRAVTSDSDAMLVVYNRHGIELFSGTAMDGWGGGGSPAGVYFWKVIYRPCGDELRIAKGAVTLIR
jgi:hypothetical protein